MNNELREELQVIQLDLENISRATGFGSTSLNPNVTIISLIRDIWDQHDDNHKALLLAMKDIRFLLSIIALLLSIILYKLW